ncbi:hypothetical protein ACIBCM_17335 [Streptomyces sp. NPDC051018]|uniref:hypothetical protein n=1 Tax=Streptomyces sp. NPDC051018 TaxID=3365639 RepID=UPI0037ACBA51
MAGFLLAGPGTGPVAHAALVARVPPEAGPGSVGAFALCSGRHLKTVRFATGEVRVYRNRQSACAVTIAKRPGARRAMAVSIQARGGRPVVEKGPFRRQAGPVSVFALNRCVRASGSVAGVGRSTGWISC